MACAKMLVGGTDPDTGSDYSTTIQACTHKNACSGWEGTVEEISYKIQSCDGGSQILVAGFAAALATAFTL